MPVWTPAEMHHNAVTKDPHMQRESEGPVCSWQHGIRSYSSGLFFMSFPLIFQSLHQNTEDSPSLQCPTLIEIRKISSAI